MKTKKHFYIRTTFNFRFSHQNFWDSRFSGQKLEKILRKIWFGFRSA